MTLEFSLSVLQKLLYRAFAGTGSRNLLCCLLHFRKSMLLSTNYEAQEISGNLLHKGGKYGKGLAEKGVSL